MVYHFGHRGRTFSTQFTALIEYIDTITFMLDAALRGGDKS